MSWFDGLPVMFVAAALLFAPGLVIARIAGLRGLWSAAVAPVLTLALLAIASLVLPLLGLSWRSDSALGFVLIVGVLWALIVRRFAPFRDPGPREQQPGRGTVTLYAWLLSAVPILVLCMLGIGAPDAFMQQSDNNYHLNLITSILDRGTASPLTANALVAPEAAFAFYPDLWHAAVSLVIQLTGAEISVAVHSFNIVAAAGIWPLGMLLLVRQLVSDSSLAMLSTGVLAAAFTAFPLNLLRYGVLYAFFFGVLLVPVMLAVLLQLVRLSRDRSPGSALSWGALFLLLLPAQAVAHPSTLMLLIALSVPLIVVWLCRGWRAIDTRSRVLRAIGATVAAAAVLACWVLVRPGFVWPALYPLWQGAQQLVLVKPIGYGVPFVLGALTLTGVCRAVTQRTAPQLALAGMWGMGALLYLATASLEVEPLRSALVGNWYGDLPRVAAGLVIVVIPAAVLGLTWLLSLPRARSFSRGPLLALTIALLFIATQFSAGWQLFVPRMRLAHTTTETSPLLTLDERRLIDRLPELVPEHAVIAGNPWTGTSLAYALGGRHVLLAHLGAEPTANGALILASLRDADTRPDVCQAIIAERVMYVLDFGTQEPYDGGHRYPGIEQLDESEAVELVASEGEASLYRVTACNFASAS